MVVMCRNRRLGLPTIVCKCVWFYSEGDETSFFNWTKNITCVADVKGVSDEIHLVIEGTIIPDEDLQELIAVLTRYKIDLSQLAQFKSESNKEWFFDNKEAFWLKQVFGEAEGT